MSPDAGICLTSSATSRLDRQAVPCGVHVDASYSVWCCDLAGAEKFGKGTIDSFVVA